jgi:8-oxo-dGTP diphosphatase
VRKPRVQKKKVVRIILLNDNLEMLLVRQKTRQLWQFPGGIISAKENPLAAAKRELREETNIRLNRLKLIHTETVQTGVVEEVIYTFFGTLGKTKAMAPDGKEIDKLAWTSIQNSFNLPLTDTTKILMSNVAIIELFV